MNEKTVLPASDATVQEFDWGELVWYANGKMGNSATMTFGRAVLKPGHDNFRHSHPNCEEILHVLSGHIVHLTPGGRALPHGTRRHDRDSGQRRSQRQQ